MCELKTDASKALTRIKETINADTGGAADMFCSRIKDTRQSAGP